ncbi:OLC1v1003607C1 [Oldenlandia corymbosa var. corymbosa]|uniref:OLC1v1003607C1 n=1 Tax=Oldenlandia corymbosa var. corymbosa TaxID=529605 RepID=A0AAV1DBQ5_OLDCO|nr:OLC1v1003607C1 [Oldenlandia corymbosa var. corymbosa]
MDMETEVPAPLEQDDGNPATKKVKNREEASQTADNLSFKEAILKTQQSEKIKMPPRKQVKIQMRESMGFSVIVSPLGRTVGYQALYNQLMAIWQPTGEIEVADSINGH